MVRLIYMLIFFLILKVASPPNSNFAVCISFMCTYVGVFHDIILIICGTTNSLMKMIRRMTTTTTMATTRTMHKITRAILNERDFQHFPTLDNSPSCVQYNKGGIDKLKLNTQRCTCINSVLITDDELFSQFLQHLREYPINKYQTR